MLESAGKLWVLAFMWLQLDENRPLKKTCRPSSPLDGCVRTIQDPRGFIVIPAINSVHNVMKSRFPRSFSANKQQQYQMLHVTAKFSAKILYKWTVVQCALPPTKTAQEWSEECGKVLNALGWPSNFLAHSAVVHPWDVRQQVQSIEVPPGSLQSSQDLTSAPWCQKARSCVRGHGSASMGRTCSGMFASSRKFGGQVDISSGLFWCGREVTLVLSYKTSREDIKMQWGPHSHGFHIMVLTGLEMKSEVCFVQDKTETFKKWSWDKDWS